MFMFILDVNIFKKLISNLIKKSVNKVFFGLRNKIRVKKKAYESTLVLEIVFKCGCGCFSKCFSIENISKQYFFKKNYF